MSINAYRNRSSEVASTTWWKRTMTSHLHVRTCTNTIYTLLEDVNNLTMARPVIVVVRLLRSLRRTVKNDRRRSVSFRDSERSTSGQINDCRLQCHRQPYLDREHTPSLEDVLKPPPLIPSSKQRTDADRISYTSPSSPPHPSLSSSPPPPPPPALSQL